ncbi:MAG: HNH endonuclease signature motif containing protein, partial [Methylobacter sp.]
GIKSAIANSGQFKSGDISWNKGAIGVRVSPATEFKKGNAPHNVLPIGTELMKDDDYLWVKVADPNVWRQKHRIVWESIHGAQPKGTAIVFLDGDRLNFDPDNLQLLTRRELLQMNRNKYSQAPAELKPSVLAVSRLQSAIYTRSREE